MASRFKAARAGVAALGAALIMMTTAAIPATAEPATGFPDGEVPGYHVNMGKGKLKEILAKLVGFRLSDGTDLDMYCVEIRTNLDHRREMAETPWDEYPDPDSPFHANRDRINWILHNSFPVVGRQALAQTLRDAGVTLHGGLNREEAITGTQAAIWHFSDGVDLNRKNPLPVVGKAFDADVLALYDHLTGDANTGIGDQPTPALEVSPAELTGEAGERIGPFTVTTTGTVSDLTADLPEGVRITDAEGNDMAAGAIENGTELYLDVPADAADGEATFELTARARIDTGRLFVGIGYEDKKTQSVIVAKAARSEITVAAGASWTAAPPTSSTTPPPSTETTTTTTPPSTPPTTTTSEAPVPQERNDSGLATTGASVLAPVVIGLVLVGAGVIALLVLRRRRA
jgi:TQXA domain-containing protein